MRKIKFRAWNPEDNKMEFPVTFSGSFGTLKPLILCSDGWRAYKDYPLEQFTGLKDKNGVEIYEGDVVKFNHFWFASTIEYIGSAYYLSQGDGIICIGTENGPASDELEVIGNIHQNPELL